VAYDLVPGPGDIELCLVVPTYNEAGNIDELVKRVRQALVGISWELIVVDDDSSDGTASSVRRISLDDHRVRCIQRLGRRGLSGACLEGMLASSAPFLALMDGDLQHDESRLPHMLNLLRSEKVDLVVGSRYISGGSIGDWGATRSAMSRSATRLSRFLTSHDIADPMSGFFMLRRDVVEASMRSMSTRGFKILLDLLASAPATLRIAEVPYTLRMRPTGESKLDAVVLWEFGVLVADKLVGPFLPVRLVMRAALELLLITGQLGAAVVLVRVFGAPLAVGQAVAAVIAAAFSFRLQVLLTHPFLPRHTGFRTLGLVALLASCAVGIYANVRIALHLVDVGAGWVAAMASGVLVGAVWNAAVAHVFSWNRTT
jgi:dolichol-phosphate mannosyltransferase